MTSTEQTLRIGWMSHHVEGMKPLLDLLAAGIPIAGIITLEPDLLAKRSGAAAYEEIAALHGLALHRIRNVNNPDSLALLERLHLDVLFVIGWSQILRKDALSLVKVGCFGAHASLLPANRGSAPINWALIKGEKQTGNTLMKLSVEVDGGDIVAQRAFDITPFDNVATLYDKVGRSNSEMLLELAQELVSGQPVQSTPQVDDGSPLLPRRRPEHGQIDWHQPAKAVYDFIRALTRPYPGAFSFIAGKRYFVWRSALLPMDAALAPAGTILGPVVSDDDTGCGIAVACQRGAIVLHEIERDDGTQFTGQSLATEGLSGKWSEGEPCLD